MVEYINDNQRIKTIIRKNNNIDELSIKNMTTPAYENLNKNYYKNYYNNLNKVIKGNDTEIPHITDTYWKNKKSKINTESISSSKKEKQFIANSILGGDGSDDTVICTTDKSVDDLLNCIKNQLQTSELSYNDINDNFVLKLNNDITINVECFIYLVTNNNTYNDKCDNNVINNFIVNNTVSFDKFFPQSDDKTFKIKFNEDMYKYILSIIKFIVTNNNLKNMANNEQTKLINALCTLISKEIEYNTNLILQKIILQDKYYKINYNLLYLYIILNTKYINEEKIKQLQDLYDKLIKTINDNIEAYKTWKDNIINSEKNNKVTNDIDNIIKELDEKINKLEEENKLYKSEINNFSDLKNQLEPKVDPFIKDLTK